MFAGNHGITFAADLLEGEAHLTPQWMLEPKKEGPGGGGGGGQVDSLTKGSTLC
jgi:hypothetical protein